jgi:glutathione S-transferase
MSEIIFHHYPPSPVAEKVRVALGIKQLSWHSVIIPRIPPKPLLMPLTGGFRRTPVMQIGADIYCDSQCILRELQKREPEPSLYCNASGDASWALSRWSDTTLFELCAKIILAIAAPNMPEEFSRDRGRLYFGPDYSYAKIHDELPHLIAQLRAQLGWVDQQLSGIDDFMQGEQATLPDALIYYLVWFLRGRWEQGPEFLAQFPALVEWEQRVDNIGHGQSTDMEAQEALDVAKKAEPITPAFVAENDPQHLKLGMKVSIAVDEDSGEQPVVGEVRFADRETIGVLISNDQVGTVCVNFPRVGYRIEICE